VPIILSMVFKLTQSAENRYFSLSLLWYSSPRGRSNWPCRQWLSRWVSRAREK